MKKLVGIAAAFVALFGLTACGSKYDFTCTGKIEGVESTVKGTVKDGKVSKVIMEATEEAPSEKEAKAAADMTNAMKSMMEGSGVTLEAKANGKKYTMTMTMDVTKMTEESKENAELDLSDLSKDAFIKKLTDEGLTCK